MAVITISRQYGSGGDQIATQAGEILGYRYFDKTLMAEVAAEAGLSREEVVDFSEDQHKVRSFLERLLGRPRIVGQARRWSETPTGERGAEVLELDEAESLQMSESIIRAAYNHDRIVIVGRGGQYILQNLPNVLHVRVEAPFEDRVRRVEKMEGLSAEGARSRVAERDQAAADFLHRFYGIEWSDPLHYHLVINTGKWNLEAAANILVKAVELLPPGT